ncbi:Nitrogen permease reactivator protein [Mactra antiquata]
MSQLISCVLWRNDNCNAPGGTAGVMMFKEDDVDVFIGPPCSASTTPTGLLASYWNLPMFSQASSDPSLADKSVYTTLVRLGPPFNKMGKAFVELFRLYNWTQVVVISKRKHDNRNVFCDYSSRSVEAELKNNNMEIVEFIYIEAGISDNGIDTVLDKARYRGRIILLCTEISSDRRRILIKAYTKGMTNGDYVYIIPDHLPPADIKMPWQHGDEFDDIVKEAYNSVFQVSVSEMAGPNVETFRDLVSEKMAEHPWNYNDTKLNGIRGSEYSVFLHDVVYLYLVVLNETLENNENYRNGSLIFEKAKGKTFRGMTGNVKVDSNGDREPDYWVWDLIPGESEFQVAMEISLTTNNVEKIRHLRPVIWETSDGRPPLFIPKCGLSNEFCPVPQSNASIVAGIIIGVFTLLTLIVSMVVYILYRKSKFEKEVQSQLWRVHVNDIKLKLGRVLGSASQISFRSITAMKQTPSEGSSVTTQNVQIFSLTGYYKGSIVAIKKLNPGIISLDRKDLLELKADIIENEDINLDWMFKLSLMTDLTNGMAFLHSSPLRCHGNLKSSNCLVDNRWILKLTDFGLTKIRHDHRDFNMTNYRIHSSMFWTAPENLPDEIQYIDGTQESDVYSIGVVLFEILYRRCPYDTTLVTPEEIIYKVKTDRNPPFRPSSMITAADRNETDHEASDKGFTTLSNFIEVCWSLDPMSRPTASDIKHEIITLHNGKKVNIVDNMVQMLEKYAVNLESIVEQRTCQLVEEKRKTDTLLYRMLPTTVAEDLKSGKLVEPEVFENVTIYFSDIVGFTSLSSESSPIEIVDFLNDLYTSFDSIISLHDVYKVETIGDAYMTVSGLPVRNGNKHTEEIGNMSLDLLKAASKFRIKHKPGKQLLLRIGIHTGPCAAAAYCFIFHEGVVGRTMPRYCLFGDTVNMASRMESTGEAMKIHISENSKEFLDRSGNFVVEQRGSIEVKGKGSQMTYWLLGRRTV